MYSAPLHIPPIPSIPPIPTVGESYSPYKVAWSQGYVGSRKELLKLARETVQADRTNAEPWMQKLIGKKRKLVIIRISL